MDPAAADPPCILQALPPHAPSSGTLPSLVPGLPAVHHSPAANDNTPAPATAVSSSSRPPKRRPPPPPGPAPPSPRRTRSGGAPEWTPAETLALVAEVAAVDDGWSRSVSAFQKWAMVAENLAASEVFAAARRGAKRAAGECRRRWEALAGEYGAVRRWEVRTGGGYWEMSVAARRKAGLPAEFDADVYGAMDALIRVEEALHADAVGGGGAGEVECLVGGGAGVVVGEEENGELETGEEDGEEEVAEEEGGEAEVGEEEVEVGEDEVEEDESADEEEGEDEVKIQADAGNTDAPNNFGREAETNNKTENGQNIAWELANKLQENAQHIHTILHEEADEYAGQNHTLAYSASPDAMEATREKADELIKSLGGLLSYLNQFTELIKETGFENVGMT